MKEEEVAKLRVADLKEELKKRGLAISGLKAALADRLLEAIREENTGATKADGEAAPLAEEELEAAMTADVKSAAEVEAEPKGPDEAAPDAAIEADAQNEPSSAPSEQAPEVSHSAAGKGAQGVEVAEKPAPEEKNAEAAAAEEAVQVGLDAKDAEEAKADGDEAQPAEANIDEGKEAAGGKAAAGDAPGDGGAEASEGSASPPPRHRELAAERAEAPAPAPVQDAAEEEVDYEADEVDEVATAPEEPAPHEARRPRPESESKSAAEAKLVAREKGSRGAEKESSKTDGRQTGKDEAARKDGKRKRDPIPLFVPREKRPAANGDSGKEAPASDPPESEAKLARIASNDKRSVFERLNSGAGKEEGTPQEEGAPAAPARRAPLSREAASRALLITGFIRPFTEKQAREKLSETGEISGFWMTRIKDRAYVVYATEEQAETTRHAITGIEWPLGNGNSLRPKFVPVEDAEETIKTGVPQETRRPTAAAAAAGTPSAASAQAAAAAAAAAVEPNAKASPAAKPADASAKAKSLDARAILEERRKSRAGKSEPAIAPAVALDPAADPMEVEDPAEPKTLEDLFRKTTTKPWLFWLPLTEEQIAEKAKRDAAALPGPPSKK